MDKESLRAWNEQIITEFRANGGKVGGNFEGAQLLLLHTIGAKSGKERIAPLVTLPDGDRLFIFGSKAGEPTHPDWYHNLLANPAASIEYGTETYPVRAVEITGAERDAIYERQCERFPGFRDYQAKTTRKIPVIALERIPS